MRYDALTNSATTAGYFVSLNLNLAFWRIKNSFLLFVQNLCMSLICLFPKLLFKFVLCPKIICWFTYSFTYQAKIGWPNLTPFKLLSFLYYYFLLNFDKLTALVNYNHTRTFNSPPLILISPFLSNESAKLTFGTLLFGNALLKIVYKITVCLVKLIQTLPMWLRI